jgi:hypothetical protein
VLLKRNIKVEVIVHPRTGHKGPEALQMYSLTVSLPRPWMEVGDVLSAKLPGRSAPGRDSVPIVREVGWAPRPMWIGAKNLAHTGIQFPDNPTCSASRRKTGLKFVILKMHSRAYGVQSAVREELKVRTVMEACMEKPVILT